MTAYLICHMAREKRMKAADARHLLAARVKEHWDRRAVELDGSWILQADCTSDEIRDDLLTHAGKGEVLLVVALGYDAAWNGLDPYEGDRLIEQIR